MASLSYFVLYTPDIERLKAFYGALGMSFVAEQHETGPVHYSATLDDGMVLEIYPGDAPKQGVIGIKVESIRSALRGLVGAHMPQMPKQYASNLETRSAIIRDPDNRRIELIEPR